MELPTQSGLCSPNYADSEDEDSPSRAHTRKSNKPLLEKKRRARINQSLDQLKGLVLDALKKDSARYSKLEKADILEMTVKHLRETQRHQMAAAMSLDPTVATKYQDGFGECAQEVQRYLSSIDGLSSEVRMRLMQHLNNRMSHVHQMAPYGGRPMYGGVPCASPSQSLPGLPMRCAMPYGGLAMSSPESPNQLPVSPASLYSHADYHNIPDVMFTPKSHISCDPQSRRRENNENIAPMRPLSEKTNNVHVLSGNRQNPGARHCGDSNNNNTCPPAAKRQRLDVKHDVTIHGNHGHLNNGGQNNVLNINIMDMHVKSEPVWRPW